MRSSKLYLFLLLILLSGCDDRSALRWELRFASNSDQEAAVVIETDILEGGCEGVARGVPFLLYTDGSSEPARVVLDPMLYGFRARAFDANCALIAAGCEEAILPGPEVVVTLLTSVDGEPECLPELCSRGVCDEHLPDGGPGDADVDQPDAEADADADADTVDADGDVDDVVDADADSDDVVDADPEPELMTCIYRADSADTTQELQCRNVDGNPDCYTSSWPPCSSVSHPGYAISGLPPQVDIISATLRYDCNDCDHPGEEGVVQVNGGSYSMPADDSWDDVWTNEITIDVTGSVEEGRNSVVFGPADSDCTYFVVRGVELVVEAWLYGCP